MIPMQSSSLIHNAATLEENLAHEARGVHLLLTLNGCEANILDNQEEMEKLARRAALATGAKVLQIVSHRFSPQGVTALAVLAESHASLHTYPESGVVFWDCFTCGSSCKPERSTSILEEALRPASMSAQLINRD